MLSTTVSSEVKRKRYLGLQREVQHSRDQYPHPKFSIFLDRHQDLVKHLPWFIQISAKSDKKAVCENRYGKGRIELETI